MGETAATLIAAAILVPLAIFLIYLGFRNLMASVGNVRDAVPPGSLSAESDDAAIGECRT